MKNLFINFTNHPSTGWEEKQLNEAKKYGEIVDIKFPDIDPNHSIDIIRSQADEYVSQIALMEGDTKVVHIMGEMTFTNYVVNKLQLLGIQCVASTTVRNTVTLEDGSKVSKFNFEQFRPYSTIQNRNNTTAPKPTAPKPKLEKPKLEKRDYFSIVALALVLVGEIAFLLKVNGFVGCFSYWIILAAVALIIILALVGLLLGERFNIRSVNLTKLFANAIAPRRLGVLYLFFFVLHLGWLTNAVMNLFIPTEIFTEVAISMCVCLVGMLSIVAFFPDGRIKKDENATKVFVSGISAISTRSNGEEKPNLRPLVSILHETKEDENKCEMLILHSDYYSNPTNFSKINENMESYKNYILKKIFAEDQNSFNNDFAVAKGYNEQLRTIIKYMAMVEFPEKKWIKNHLTITFTEEANYDDFYDCYKKISKPLKERDDVNHKLYFNLTPGTNSAAALMTLLAIDGSRKLFFYKQKLNVDVVSKRVVEVDKSDIPLNSLLSQALDSIM